MNRLTFDGMRATKNTRVQQIKDALRDAVPASYVGDSIKEVVCKEYLRTFADSFSRLFPDRRELFLMPENEFGIRKFVCTTIRSTLLPYREIYDISSVADFVSNYLQYEPLHCLTEMPRVLPSPTQVLQWKVGDCFDFAVLLTSLLLGSGYDAYAVIGYVPLWMSLRDQSDSCCPLIAKLTIPCDGSCRDEIVCDSRVASSVCCRVRLCVDHWY
mmetsp:Transcript_17952/g.56288  ORF Transcript_17952/g.56288 Transcript_17952/m.56288 type:complete len:214 (-) Transcript_17952:3165-3806(-)